MSDYSTGNVLPQICQIVQRGLMSDLKSVKFLNGGCLIFNLSIDSGEIALSQVLHKNPLNRNQKKLS